jgi:hypothetical protein
MTLLQVLTGDGWASAITRGMFGADGQMDAAATWFMVSYVIVGSTVLMNVVLTVTSLSLSLSLSHTHTHTHTYTQDTHTHTHFCHCW